MTTFENKLLAAAAAEIGVHEHKPNAGPKIDAWLAAAGVPSPNPWCAAFVFAMCRKAGWKGKVENPASCNGWLTWAKANGKLVARPRIGDLVVYNWDGGAQDHIGIVTSARAMSSGRFTLATIEGNTNIGHGQPDGVYRRARTIEAAKVKFIRLYAVTA